MRYHRVAGLADIPDSGCLIVSLGSLQIGLFRVGDRILAWRNVCPHMAAPVCRGTVSGTTLPSRVYEYSYGRAGQILQCPWHGWEYDLLTGHHLAPGSDARLRGYPVRVDGEDVLVGLRTRPGPASPPA